MATVSLAGHEMEVYENQEELPRPEEERITQAEKNKRMQEQLKVKTAICFNSQNNMLAGINYTVYCAVKKCYAQS